MIIDQSKVISPKAWTAPWQVHHRWSHIDHISWRSVQGVRISSSCEYALLNKACLRNSWCPSVANHSGWCKDGMQHCSAVVYRRPERLLERCNGDNWVHVSSLKLSNVCGRPPCRFTWDSPVLVLPMSRRRWIVSCSSGCGVGSAIRMPRMRYGRPALLRVSVFLMSKSSIQASSHCPRRDEFWLNSFLQVVT